eukprot:TRINITY_DN1989_c0_g2_i10.p1 TRINITY_DN1989_c0_g2~~TRINITY_DN1989_c0_g2_i10.p1  ORF type:complete len:272 (-),score=34.04 TRINITY_DN1989_c0_g2_i10:119-934(-)
MCIRDRYKHEVGVVLSYYDMVHNVPFNFDLTLAKVKPSESISYTYAEKKRSEYVAEETNDIGHISYYYPLSVVTKALSTVFDRFYAEFTLNDSSIPPESAFRLKGRHFAQVLPDFYMEKGDANITVKVKVVSSNCVAHIINKEKVNLSGLELLLLFKHEDQSLLQVNTNISGQFRGVLEAMPGDTSGLLNFAITSLEGESSNFVAYKYKAVYREGYKRYFQTALDEWIKISFDKKVLGNGIYVEDTKALDVERSKVSFEKEKIIVMLNIPL